MNKPFDNKLFILKTLRRLPNIIFMTFIIALLIIIPYGAVKVVFAPKPDASVSIMAHIEYAEDSAGNELDYINYYTWNEIVHTDPFIDEVNSHLDKTLGNNELKGMLSVTVPSDVRVNYFTVTHPDRETALTVRKALLESIPFLTEHIPEVKNIDVWDDNVQDETANDARMGATAVLSVIIGLVISLFWTWYVELMDDSVDIPLLFVKETGIPEITASTDGKYVIEIDKDMPVISSEGTETVLSIKCGAHNGKIIDAVLTRAKERNLNIVGAKFTNVDEKLNKAYFAPSKVPNPFIKTR